MARITMPQLGETVTEGTVTRWLKRPGEMVEVDEPLLEVSTDKVDTEIPAAHAGVLRRLLVAEGETVPIGTPLAVIGDADERPSAAEPRPLDAHADRRRAIRPSMEGGLGSTQQPVIVPERVARRARGAARPDVSATPPAREPIPPLEPTEVAARIPFSSIRRRTAAHLSASLRATAPAMVGIEADYTAVDTARAAVSHQWQSRHGRSLTRLPFTARAVCDALAEFPNLNAWVDGDVVVVHRFVHLGIAVDLDYEGLVVPVVRHAEEMRLETIAEAMHRVADAARRNDVDTHDLSGATFTITNAGGYGTAMSVPIVSRPQVAILSTDGVAMRPVAVPSGGGYGVAVRPVGNLSLSFDHRALDGAYAAAFLRHVRARLAESDWITEVASIGHRATPAAEAST